MIWHFFEIWLLLLSAFAVGSLLGALLYIGLARSPVARAQGVVADALGDLIDWVKTRFGVGPAWRLGIVRRIAGPSAKADLAGEVAEFAKEDPTARPSLTWPFRRRPAVMNGEDEATGSDDGDLAWGTEETGESGDLVDGGREPEPAPPPSRQTAAAIAPMRPAGLAAPRNGVPDNLQRIRGIGKRNEELLNSLGIYHFGQIAAWTPGEVRWVGAYLAFPERVERDDWIGQATILATGGDTGYVKVERRKNEAEEEDSAEP